MYECSPFICVPYQYYSFYPFGFVAHYQPNMIIWFYFQDATRLTVKSSVSIVADLLLLLCSFFPYATTIIITHSTTQSHQEQSKMVGNNNNHNAISGTMYMFIALKKVYNTPVYIYIFFLVFFLTCIILINSSSINSIIIKVHTSIKSVLIQ